MTNTHHKKQEGNKNTIGSIIAGVTGVVVAGAAVAATIALKDEKTRKKVENILVNVKDQAIDYVNKIKTDPATKEVELKIKQISTDTKKRA